MSAAHTAGPWSTGGISYPSTSLPKQNVWGPTPPGMQSGHMVCQNASVADSRLIASAPALLAALLQCVDVYDAARANTPTGLGWPDPNHIHAARAAIAIAQATGETP